MLHPRRHQPRIRPPPRRTRRRIPRRRRARVLLLPRPPLWRHRRMPLLLPSQPQRVIDMIASARVFPDTSRLLPSVAARPAPSQATAEGENSASFQDFLDQQGGKPYPPPVASGVAVITPRKVTGSQEIKDVTSNVDSQGDDSDTASSEGEMVSSENGAELTGTTSEPGNVLRLPPVRRKKRRCRPTRRPSRSLSPPVRVILPRHSCSRFFCLRRQSSLQQPKLLQVLPNRPMRVRTARRLQSPHLRVRLSAPKPFQLRDPSHGVQRPPWQAMELRGQVRSPRRFANEGNQLPLPTRCRVPPQRLRLHRKRLCLFPPRPIVRPHSPRVPKKIPPVRHCAKPRWKCPGGSDQRFPMRLVRRAAPLRRGRIYLFPRRSTLQPHRLPRKKNPRRQTWKGVFFSRPPAHPRTQARLPCWPTALV
jgi:hypothetical protein